MGTRHRPHKARSCELALRAVGAERGLPGASPCARVRGVRGWAHTLPQPPVLWAGDRGQLPIFRGRGRCGRGDPSPTSQRTLLRAGFARCEGRTRASRGEGRLLPSCGVSGVGHSPSPSRPSMGQAAGARCPFFVRALLRAGFPPCGRVTRAPAGGRLLPVCGASGVGHSPSPSPPSMGQAAGACCPFSVCGGAVRLGTHHQPHSARSCELALRTVGAAHGRPGAGASCLGVGRPGFGTLLPPATRPWGRWPGPAARFPLVGGLCNVFVQPIFSLFSVYFPDICVQTEIGYLSTVLDSVGISQSGISVVLH